MAEIRMPSLGADMDAGTLAEWKVQPGDVVARGTVVALIETQKATMELESFVDGAVEELLVPVGAKVPVGTPVARLTTATDSPTRAPAPAPDLRESPLAVDARLGAADRRGGARPFSSPSPDARPRSSPAARKLAREHDLDLARVTGTGPHGAIVLHDVEQALRSPAPPAPAPAPAPAGPFPAPAPPSPSSAPPRKPLPSLTGPVRDAIAAAMSRSKREIPHYYLSHTISLKRALAWLAAANATRPIAERIVPGALLLHAVARALWDVPELNGFYQDGAFRPSEEVHLGTAISLRTGGVIAPAILDADELSIDQLMAALHDLVARARAGRLRSRELADATITVTSLGDRGCEAVWGVINPPQVAIVGFGAVVERPWVEAGALAVHPVVTVTLAADHRVSDGHRGGLFLAALDRILQEPPP